MREFAQAISRAVSRKLAENAAKTEQSVAVMVEPWRRGTRWALAFCKIAKLPKLLALGNTERVEPIERVQAVRPLEPLHDFQEEVYDRLRSEILPHRGAAGLLSLPTGAGKTRVVVEAVVDHFVAAGSTMGATSSCGLHKPTSC